MAVDMSLEAHLEKQESGIVNKWFDWVVETYPADTSPFLRQQKDPFANPVGNTTRKSLEALFHQLLHDMDRDALVSALDPIIRIRAVQAFAPSQAVGFIASLKPIVRESIEKELDDLQIVRALLQFELRIDALSGIAFDTYMACREKIYQIKASHEKKSTYRALERAGLLAGGENP